MILLALGGLAGALPARATSILQRTYLGSATASGGAADGSSANAVLSSSGRVLAFDTSATNLAGTDANGAVRDVVAIDLATNERRLVSLPPGQPAADGPSSAPVMSSDGQRIAFISDATNLVAGDSNGVTDVFLRQGRDPIQLVSVGIGGAPANAASSEPDVSADGTRVVFTSRASNLVAGDTNGQPDIFVRDLRIGRTVRVSTASNGGQSNGWSAAPAISADGNFVAFTSAASNLVSRDNNGIMDVFVKDLRSGKTTRVSVSTAGRQQNKSVEPPFVQTPDISDDGRYVVFDSDATTLYAKDTNQHTDVFLRDLRKHTTTLVSASSTNVEGNNDSFAPRLSPKGRFLSFESFANNLAQGDGPREDIFVRDLRTGTTSVVNVTASGAPRGPEQVPQLLQRPSISSDGRFAAFSSTVTNLVPGDTNAAEDVFIRLMDAPVTRILQHPPLNHLGKVRLGADDPRATSFLCQLGASPWFRCAPSFTLKQWFGRVLRVRAGGPGMLFDEDTATVTLSSDSRPPRVTISKPSGHSLGVLRGRATDRSGVATVYVGVTSVTPRGCTHLTPKGRFVATFSWKQCPVTIYVVAKGTRKWHFRLPHAIRGRYVIYAVAVDRIGNRSTVVARRGTVS